LNRRWLSEAVVFFGLVSGLGQSSLAQQPSSAKPAAGPGVQPAAASGPAAEDEVAPGLPLPGNGIVWVLEGQMDKPELVRLYHNRGHWNRHAGANAARSFAWMKATGTVDLPDPGAKIKLNTHSPVILVRKAQEEDEELESDANGKAIPLHYALLRLQVDKDHRVLCWYSYARFSGKPARRAEEVAVSTEEIGSGKWVKLTAQQPLPDGQYGVVRMPDDEQLAPDVVFDFAIGGASP